MGAYYDEVEIEDMVWDDEKRVYHYPCPCGDRFEISREQLRAYEDIATCPSCSLVIRVVYDPLDYQDEDEDEDEDDVESGGESSEDAEDSQEDQDQESDAADSENDSERFQDALDNLHISEYPHNVIVSA